jgi:hypothetical protein
MLFFETELQGKTAAGAGMRTWHAPPFRHLPTIVGWKIMSGFTAESLAGLTVSVRLAVLPVNASGTCIPTEAGWPLATDGCAACKWYAPGYHHITSNIAPIRYAMSE